MSDELGYADAMAELESILDDLEDDDLDVDVLASRVERASVLIQLCRDRIGSARIQVEKVVASLDAGDDSDGDEHDGSDSEYPEVATLDGIIDGNLDLDADGG